MEAAKILEAFEDSIMHSFHLVEWKGNIPLEAEIRDLEKVMETLSAKEDLIKAAESGDIFLLYRRNLRYLKGRSKWTLQGKHFVYEVIASFVIALFLLMFFTSVPDPGTRSMLLWITAIFFACLSLWIAHKIKKERDLARNGRLIRGRITKCELTMGGSDVDMFIIEFVFDGIESFFKTSLNRELASTLPEREIIVLFLNTKNLLVL